MTQLLTRHGQLALRLRPTICAFTVDYQTPWKTPSLDVLDGPLRSKVYVDLGSENVIPTILNTKENWDVIASYIKGILVEEEE